MGKGVFWLFRQPGPRYDGNKAEPANRGERMSIVTRAMPAAISLTVVAVVTAILWYFKLTPFSLRDPVFFYRAADCRWSPWSMAAARLCSARARRFSAPTIFLYDPLYSFAISTRVEAGDLACFSVLALIGVKCVGELFRPTVKPRKSPNLTRRVSAIKIGTRADRVPYRAPACGPRPFARPRSS